VISPGRKGASVEALEELRSALQRRGNVKLLNLLALAEGSLGLETIAPRRTIHGTSYERLSPEGYWSDGSMRCPYEQYLGHVACDYHTCNGCSNDPDDAAETARLLAQEACNAAERTELAGGAP